MNQTVTGTSCMFLSTQLAMLKEDLEPQVVTTPEWHPNRGLLGYKTGNSELDTSRR